MANVKKSEQTKKDIRTPSGQGLTTAQYLDKLEHLDTAPSCKGYRATKETLKQRAKFKSISFALMNGLLSIDSPLSKGYRLTKGFCAQTLLHQGTKIVSRYCGYRWCPVCNRIRVGKYINGYLPVFEQMQDPYFVTLTAPTCLANELVEVVDDRNYKWSAILKHSTSLYNRGKIDFRLKGIRKLETTARPNNRYNVHFHLIVDGKDSADFIKAQWLYRYPKAIRRLQDVKRADKGSLHELFKYMTKFWTIDKETGDQVIYTPKQMDTIFRAIKGKRTVNTFGGIRLIKDNIENIESMEFEDIEPTYDVSEWDQSVKDWISTYGEIISGYEPADEDLRFVDRIELSVKSSQGKAH